MKNIIIGTAGHVDHGKTTLIRALTGTNTDRLREEQERGMTIDIGFASLALPNGQSVGIVDVPGHERFIKNMLAGAGGVDVTLMVVAADESVMPQTVEHLAILQLLEVKRGIIALTKADMVDEEWIEAVADDVRRAFTGTFLANAPIIPVAAPTGRGLSELLDALQNACEDAESRKVSGPFRLPIDRVFTSTGFGTVVTGTLTAGTMKIGDPVEIMPNGLSTRIRGLQVHGKKVESAGAGTRVAVNLAGLEVAELTRGDICASPGSIHPSNIFDIRITLLKDAQHTLKNGVRVRFHVGTAELLGRVKLLDKDELVPGEQAYAQFRAEKLAAASRGDRFVIRMYSPMVTIGGGMILNPNPRKHKRFDQSVITSLETESKGSPLELAEHTVREAVTGITASDLAKKLSTTDVANLLDTMRSNGICLELTPGKYIHSDTLAEFSTRITDALTRFHAQRPLKPGMPKEELRATTAKALDNRSFTALLALLEQRGEISVSDTFVFLAGWSPNLNAQQESALKRMVSEIENGGLNAQSASVLLDSSGLAAATAKELLDLLENRGEIVKIADDIYLHRSAVEHAEVELQDFLAKNGKITVSEFRDLVGTSRKYAVPLLEYFDSKRITKRQGDVRLMVAH